MHFPLKEYCTKHALYHNNLSVTMISHEQKYMYNEIINFLKINLDFQDPQMLTA